MKINYQQKLLEANARSNQLSEALKHLVENDSISECEKCGISAIETTYVEKGELITSSSLKKVDRQVVGGIH